MRRPALVLALLAICVPLGAQWESSWDTSFCFPLGDPQGAPFAGFTARAGFDDLSALKLRLGCAGGLRVLSEGEEAPSVMPWAGLWLGRDFRLGGLLVVSPLLAGEVRTPLDATPVAASLGVTGGISVGVRLSEAALVLLTGEVSGSITGSTPAFLSVSVGIRRSRAREVRREAGSPPVSVGGAATAEPEQEPPSSAQAPSAPPSWRIGPTLFSPDGDGENDTLSVDISLDSPELVASWRFEVLDSAGALFYSTGDDGAPPARLEWDGMSGSGALVDSAREYAVVLTLTDTQGGVATLVRNVLVDILVIKDGDRYRIRLPTIEFLPDSDAVEAESGAELLDRNRFVLTKLAEILSRFPDYAILIEGHANSVHWRDPERAAVEQREELTPLSLRRAESVKEALAALGIGADRMATVGRGGSEPIVPFSDEPESGRNRRVDIILLK